MAEAAQSAGVANSRLPLSGAKVLDLTDEAGVFGARMLADLGADVLRLEPIEGDSVRRRAPSLHGQAGLERSLAHLLYNGGKRSLALAFDRAESWDLVEPLLDWADIVVGPLRKGPEVRRFLDPLRLEARHPNVSQVELVFRRDDPEAPASDLAGVAAGGMLWLNGLPDDPPNYPAGKLAYKQTSIAGAFAAISLLAGRSRGGSARIVTVSMQEAITWTTIQTANQNVWEWERRSPGRTGAGIAGGTSIFAAADGRWVSFVIPPPYWRAWAAWVREVLGDDSWGTDEWADPHFRVGKAAAIAEVTRRLCAVLPRDFLVDEGQSRHLLVCPVNTVSDLASDPHLNARAFFNAVWEPALNESVRLPAAAFRSNVFHAQAAPAPALGEHTREVLSQLCHLGETATENLIAEATVAVPASRPGEEISGVALLPSVRPEGESVGENVAEGRMRVNADMSSPALRRQPLAGVRVLDFCWLIAGPLATRLLADLGADVIKVESIARLDRIREGVAKPPGGATINNAPVFNDCNVNKRSIRLNLGTAEGLAIAKRLAATADIVTSNFTPERMDRWGLGYSTLDGIRPGIIVASMPVMGRDGPHSHWGSYGNGVIAMSGISSLTGFPDRPPVGLGPLYSDFTAPYFLAMQVVAALHHRDRTGEGQSIEIAQYETAVSLLDTELVEFLNNGTSPEQMGNRSVRDCPHGVFPAAGEDRWIAFSAGDEQWRPLCNLLGRPDLAARADLAILSGRKANEDAIEAAVSDWTSARPASESVKALIELGLAASEVERVEDLVAHDPSMGSYFEAVAHPETGSILTQHEPVTWDGDRLPIRRAPLFGEHTYEVMHELGVSDERFAELVAGGVLS